MKKMTIIELLYNSIIKNEHPKRLLFDNKLFEYDRDFNDYAYIDNQEGKIFSILDYCYNQEFNLCFDSDSELLTMEIEIIEE